MTTAFTATLTGAALTAMLIAAAPANTASAAQLNKIEKTFAELDKLSPADRHAKIVAAAKKEGKVIISVGPSATGRRHVRLFDKRYPYLDTGYLRVNSARSQEIFLSEEAAGKHLTDAMAINAPDLGIMFKRDLAARFPTPAADKIEKKYNNFKDPQNRWHPYYTSAHGITYNPRLLKELKIDPPKSYLDLCHPRFKGQVSYEPAEARMIIGLWEMYARDDKKLIQWMTCMGKNEPITMRGHTTRTDLMLAGDHAVSPDMLIYNGTKKNDKNPKKAPFKVNYDAPLLVTARGVIINKNAANPMRAAMFSDWVLSTESQKFLFKEYRGTVVGPHPFMPDNAILIPTKNIDVKKLDWMFKMWKKHVSNAGN
jgi:ABC-type Fe3+ transport system substrate-binding protein